MKKLLLLAFSSLLSAGSYYGPLISDTNNVPCIMSAATSTTPIKVTVTNKTYCGIVSGSKIWIGGALNGGSSNNRSPLGIHAIDDTDTNDECRTVIDLETNGNTTNQFSVYKCDGTTPVAYNETGPGSSTYATGGIITRQVLYPIRPHPILFMDGTGAGGTGGNVITAGLSNTGSTGWANTSRIWTQLLNTSAAAQTGFTVPLGDWNAGRMSVQALKFWQNQATNTANRDNAINALVNTPLLPSAACDTTVIDCDHMAGSDIIDYLWETNTRPYLLAYTLLHHVLSPTQIATWVNNFIDGRSWHKGGWSYTGQNRTTPAWHTMTGGCTITTGSSSPIVTGSGCNWDTQVTAVIDVAFIGNSQSGQWYGIASVDGPNQVTLSTNVNSDFSPLTAYSGFKFGPAWREGTDIGFVEFGYNNFFNVLCRGDIVHDNLSCPDHTTDSGGALDVNNHTRGRVMRAIEGALACADDDIRCRNLLTESTNIYYHLIRPVNQRYGGVTESSSGYVDIRIWPDVLEFYTMLKNSLVGSPDFTNGDDAPFKAAANWSMGQLSPTSFGVDFNNTIQTAGEMGFTRAGGELFWPCLAVVHDRPSFTEARQCLGQFRNTSYYPKAADVSYLGGAGHGGFLLWYILDRPDATTVAPPLSLDLAALGTLTSSASNVPEVSYVDERRFGFVSRNQYNLPSVDTSLLFCDLGSNIPRDHFNFSWPNCTIQMGNTGLNPGGAETDRGWVLMNSDAGSFPYLASFGADGSTVALSYVGTVATTGRSLPLSKHLTNTVAMMSADVKRQSSPNPTTAYQRVTHLKGAGGNGYAMRRYEMTNTGGVTSLNFRELLASHAQNNGGSYSATTRTAQNSPTQLSLAFPASGPKLFMNVYGPCVVSTQGGSLSDPSYTGSPGNFGRYHFSASGTAVTCWELLKWGRSTITGIPPVVQTTSGAHEVFEIKDPSNPAVLFSASPGVTNQITCTATTTYTGTGQAACEGLAAGTYEVRVDGDLVADCDDIEVTAASHLADCASGVPSGDLVFQAAGGPSLAILTASPLANCTVGLSCIRSIVATGGTAPYTYALQSGTLQTGLSLSGAGVITGTPTIAVTRALTIRATDAAVAHVDKVISLTTESVIEIGDVRQLRFRMRSRKPADTVVIEYGPAADNLGTTSSTSCASGCTVRLDVPIGAALYYRVKYTLSGVDVGPFSSVRSITIP